MLGAGAALRLGEATGLAVPRVDFLRRRVLVHEQMQRRQLAPLKTRASRRTVPIDDVVLQVITSHIQRWRPGPGQRIITNRLGAPVQRNSFGERWREAVATARTCGKPPADPRTRRKECGDRCADPLRYFDSERPDRGHAVPAGTRFHDLRHFYASALIQAGLNPKVIQARLGHATMAETMDTYGHLFPDADELGRGTMDGLLMPAEVPSECPGEVGS